LGAPTRGLEPLYSLADFCYVVKREVVEAVGPADETYGLGPCWEMDYNIRAARAGFRGVWACRAYVHRAPFPARRQEEEARRFAASKQRYQDKFCGLRLRGEKADYEPHCRGDACPHFAPPNLITGGLTSTAPEMPAASTDPPAAPVPTPGPSALPVVARVREPLVSCIMPTGDRRAFVPQAIRYFLRQDYSHLELIVVDDGADPVADCLPDDPRIRYVRLAERRPVGAKRNVACAAAHGEIIVHWDDDDWYPPGRVRAQVAALVDHPADLCGSSQVFYYDPARDRAWRYAYPSRRRPWIAGNTLAYRKTVWEANPFSEIQVGEDSHFVWSSAARGIYDLAQPDLTIATIHRANTSHKNTGGAYWQPQPAGLVQGLLGADLPFYRALVSATAPPPTPRLPLVSCIMPTYNRRPFLPLALQHFHDQDYPHKELLVIDDGPDAVEDLCAGHPGVRYLRLPTRASIGHKRNLACRQAHGAIIALWDDDDWYSPERLRYQTAPLLAGEADLTGLQNAFVLDLLTGICWTTHPTLHQQMFVEDVHGGTLVYDRRLLEDRVHYPETNLAEDAALLRQAVRRGKRLARLANPGLFVYVRHGHNAWRFTPGEFLDPARWQQCALPPAFAPATLARYQAAAANNPAPALPERAR
jgi:glycosyltransferase involved in cell wall biosynthesis